MGTCTFWYHYLHRGVMGSKAREVRRDRVVAALNAKPENWSSRQGNGGGWEVVVGGEGQLGMVPDWTQQQNKDLKNHSKV